MEARRQVTYSAPSKLPKMRLRQLPSLCVNQAPVMFVAWPNYLMQCLV